MGSRGEGATRSKLMSLAALPPGSPGNLLLTREKELLHQVNRSKTISLGIRRLVVDLLGEVLIFADLFDDVKLGFEPVHALFLIDEDVFEELP